MPVQQQSLNFHFIVVRPVHGTENSSPAVQHDSYVVSAETIKLAWNKLKTYVPANNAWEAWGVVIRQAVITSETLMTKQLSHAHHQDWVNAQIRYKCVYVGKESINKHFAHMDK
jgi:hypothetical protein